MTAPNSNGVTIPVTLNVSSAGLSLTPTTLTFNLFSNTFSQQTVSVLSTGGTVQFNASAQATGGNWLSVQPNFGTTPGALMVKADTTGLVPGKYSGTVSVSAGGNPMLVQVTLNVVPLTLNVDTQSITFAYQTGTMPFPSQTVNLISSGPPIPVIVSAATAKGGSWLIATASGGQAATAVTVSADPTNLAPGTYAGTVLITPQDTTISPVRIPVTITITPGAGPVVNAVVNAASSTAGQVAPGEYVSIYGAAMGQDTASTAAVTDSNTLATTLGNTRVLFDGVAAPLLYVSAKQVNAIVPYEVYGRPSTQLQVEYNGVRSTPVTLGVTGAAPGIFVVGTPDPTAQAAALNQDMSANSTSNGAAPGSIISLYATGEGQTNPAGTTGAIIGSTLPMPMLPVLVRIGGLLADVTYAGSAPGFASGLLQVNVRIPAGVPNGTPVPVILSIGGAVSNQAMIAIAP